MLYNTCYYILVIKFCQLFIIIIIINFPATYYIILIFDYYLIIYFINYYILKKIIFPITCKLLLKCYFNHYSENSLLNLLLHLFLLDLIPLLIELVQLEYYYRLFVFHFYIRYHKSLSLSTANNELSSLNLNLFITSIHSLYSIFLSSIFPFIFFNVLWS